MTIVHKNNPPLGPLCGERQDGQNTVSDYWDAVTCDDCLDLKPARAGARTSFKHSHRAEGNNDIG